MSEVLRKLLNQTEISFKSFQELRKILPLQLI